MKKTFAIILTFCLVLSLCVPFASAEDAVREFTDDCGRTVTIPTEVKRIAVSGPLAQIYLMSVCPELLVGLSSPYTEADAGFISEEYLSLPVLGQLYGGKGSMNLEELLNAAPDVIVDVGEAKGSIVEDLDGLTEQIGIPFVHIDATVATSDKTFIRLGELTGKAEKATQLSSWCREVYDNTLEIMEKVDADNARKNLVYCLGSKGLNVLAEGSFHAETLGLLANNVAVVSDVTPSGMGNEIDMEQLMIWNPEVIIFAHDSIYSEIAGDELWHNLDAVANDSYYKTPFGVFGWLASPPAVQRYLGMLWLTAIVYPDYVNYELQDKVTEFYELFFECDLSDAAYEELIKDAVK